MNNTHQKRRHEGFYARPFFNIINEVANTAMNDLAQHDFTSTSKPKANIVEHEDRYDILLAVPGYKKEDLTMKVEKDKLVVSSAKEADELPLKVKEFVSGQFSRAFILPENVDKTTIKASLSDGILLLNIFKKPEAQPFNIEVQ